jgi:transposase InsO family protein
MQKHVHGMKLTSAQPSPCHPCIASKITCRPFPKSAEPQERRPLDLLHMDIDFVNVPGRNGEKYFLFFTDDFSGFCFGSAITSRSGQVILDCLMNILPYIERQTGNTLKAIRSDNALEFCSGIFPAKLKQLGISQEFTL